MLPYQTLKALFKFRNLIAHGKSKILEETNAISSKDGPYVHAPKTEWEEYCELDSAKRAKEDILKVIKELHKQAGLGNDPFIMNCMTISSVTPKAPNN